MTLIWEYVKVCLDYALTVIDMVPQFPARFLIALNFTTTRVQPRQKVSSIRKLIHMFVERMLIIYLVCVCNFLIIRCCNNIHLSYTSKILNFNFQLLSTMSLVVLAIRWGMS